MRRRVHIDRLDLTLKGVSSSEARQVAARVGREIANELSGQEMKGNRRIESVKVPPLKVGRGEAATSGSRIAKQVAREITTAARPDGNPRGRASRPVRARKGSS